MFTRCLFIAPAVLIAGCATRPISNAKAVDVPSDRIIDSTYLRPVSKAGRITIKRDRGLLGMGCSSRIFVNTQPVADIRTSERIVLYLPAGNYVFSAQDNCDGGMSEVQGTVTSSSELNFRVGYESSGDFAIHATAF